MKRMFCRYGIKKENHVSTAFLKIRKNEKVIIKYLDDVSCYKWLNKNLLSKVLDKKTFVYAICA